MMGKEDVVVVKWADIVVIITGLLHLAYVVGLVWLLYLELV